MYKLTDKLQINWRRKIMDKVDNTLQINWQINDG